MHLKKIPEKEFKTFKVFTFPVHCKCWPGTESEVTNIVTQRSKNTVPMRLHSLRRSIDLGKKYIGTDSKNTNILYFYEENISSHHSLIPLGPFTIVPNVIVLFIYFQ